MGRTTDSGSENEETSEVITEDTSPFEETIHQLKSSATDFKQRFCGHCNTTTDIKEANFFGR